MLNDLRNAAHANAEAHGFHKNWNFGMCLMLIVCELSEALEADRAGKWVDLKHLNDTPESVDYKAHIKGTVEEEIADAVIRLLDLAGCYDIDLDWHVKAKMEFNKSRPYMHGKKY